LDIVYIFRHSQHGDEELRYSLRSVARHMNWVRQVWVFGDRPAWLSSDTRYIQHVAHDQVAWIDGFKTPVKNMFLMLYLIALLPDVEADFLLFCDDYILLQDLTPEMAIRKRALQDLDAIPQSRGKGLFKETLWRTYDLLKRLGYPRINYEVHVPLHHKKRWILDAVRDFRDYLTEDRFYGPLCHLTIFNHVQKREPFVPVYLAEEGKYAGFHFKQFPYEEIRAKCADKVFLNFDDDAYDANMQRFLAETFPDPCVYEATYQGPAPERPSAPAFGLPPLPETLVQSFAPARASRPVIEHGRPVGLPAEREVGSTEASRCAVLVPYWRSIHPSCEAGLRELEQRGYAVRRVPGLTALDVGRSQLASDVVAEGFDETVWIDPDIGFQADQVEALRRHGLPLCGAVYPEVGQRALAARFLPGTKEMVLGRGGGLNEVLYAGMGFLHVRRAVYERIGRTFALPHCMAVAGGRPFVPYFLPLLCAHGEREWYLREGDAFCYRARETGVPVVVDTTIRLTRVGEAAQSWEEAGIAPPRFATFRYRF
jgi:hypothetical protein